MGDGIGITSWRTVDGASVLNRFETAIWAFEDGVKSTDEVVKEAIEHLMEV